MIYHMLSQAKIIANARVLTSYRGPGGNGTTLAELNYSFVSLDDAWQACGKGTHGSFHDTKGQSKTCSVSVSRSFISIHS